ncbi:hypothetical protein WN943_019139 [Citrus x changshan-huyou]
MSSHNHFDLRMVCHFLCNSIVKKRKKIDKAAQYLDDPQKKVIRKCKIRGVIDYSKEEKDQDDLEYVFDPESRLKRRGSKAMKVRDLDNPPKRFSVWGSTFLMIRERIRREVDRMLENTATTGEHGWAPSAGVFPFESRAELDKNVIPLESNGDSDEFTNQLEYDKGIENYEKLVDKRKVEIPEIANKKAKKVKKGWIKRGEGGRRYEIITIY